MATPRRAAQDDGGRTGTRRRLAFGLVIAVLAAGLAVGAVLVVRDHWDTTAGGPSTDRAADDGRGSAPSSSKPSATSSRATNDQADSQDVQACMVQVTAAETVIATATTGIDHWRQHVQAQTDHLNGAITRTEMKSIFKRTKLAGPADQTGWDVARRKWRPDEHACTPKPDADKKTVSTLRICNTRLTALEQAMPAARNGMRDWTSHLAAMRRSAAGEDPDPMVTWLDAWHAAPKDLKAWKSAHDRLADVPRCTG